MLHISDEIFSTLFYSDYSEKSKHLCWINRPSSARVKSHVQRLIPKRSSKLNTDTDRPHLIKNIPPCNYYFCSFRVFVPDTFFIFPKFNTLCLSMFKMLCDTAIQFTRVLWVKTSLKFCVSFFLLTFVLFWIQYSQIMSYLNHCPAKRWYQCLHNWQLPLKDY